MKRTRLFQINSEAATELPNGNLMMLMKLSEKSPSRDQLVDFSHRVARRLVNEF